MTDGWEVIETDKRRRLVAALQKIAHGREDCGRPLAGEDARHIARALLTDLQINWTAAANEGE